MTTQSTLPKPGVYRIIEYGVHGQPQVLSVDKDRNVTISGAGTLPTFEQEWRLEVRDGQVALQYRADLWPSHSLSYGGIPEAGKKIVLGKNNDFPTRAWNLTHAPHLPGPFKPYFISVAGKDLRVIISPKHIAPRQLELSDTGHHHPHSTAWIFELVRT